MIIKGTKTTPEIILDDFCLTISGESYPENVIVFYEPVFQWINKKIENHDDIKIIFKLIYFNTNSSKVITDMLLLLNEYHLTKNKKVEVEWRYGKNDFDIKESAEDFFYEIQLPYKIIED